MFRPRPLLIATAFVLASVARADPLPAPISDADYMAVDPAEAALGQLLFYDPILSGNRNIACATCHHPDFATSDGLSLGLGEGGIGLGPRRRPDPANLPEDLIPRNSPALFNLGAREFTVLFHDGRIEASDSRPSGFRTPLDDDMLGGFTSLLSAQTMFPVLSPDEMAGHFQENDVARAVRQGLITGPGGAWDILARRVARLDAYVQRFQAVYPQIDSPDDIGFTDISNAIAAFVAHEWRSDTSAFDALLRDPSAPLPDAARTGLSLFYGEAGCADCHAGPFLTDHDFHAMGAPQLGPGKAAVFETHTRDTGRMAVTGNPADAYAFRTPSLRNVTRTGPWGHAGGHDTLAQFLSDHLAPATALQRFAQDGPARDGVVLPPLDGAVWQEMDSTDARTAILAAATGRRLEAPGTEDIAALIAFLGMLEDSTALAGRLGIPDTVPSGLPVGGIAR